MILSLANNGRNHKEEELKITSGHCGCPAVSGTPSGQCDSSTHLCGIETDVCREPSYPSGTVCEVWSPSCNEPLKRVEFQQNLHPCLAQNGPFFNGLLLCLFIRTLQLNLDRQFGVGLLSLEFRSEPAQVGKRIYVNFFF